MAPKVIAMLFLLHATPGFAQKSTHYSAYEHFKNYALSTCIADGFNATEVRTDAAAAARAYIEFGEYPMEAHTEATLLGRSFLAKEYKSHSGSNLTLMKCIDFYHSDELEKIATKYDTK